MEDMEYVKLLLAKADGKDVNKELEKYKGFPKPYWFLGVQNTDAVLKFSSSKAPGKYILRLFRDGVRGLRLNQHRPDKVEIIWAGKNFNMESRAAQEIINYLPHTLTTEKRSMNVEDLLKRQLFILRMQEGLDGPR